MATYMCAFYGHTIRREAKGPHVIQGVEDGVLETISRCTRTGDLRLDAELDHIRCGEI
jgi:hypothetical protein